MFRWTLSRELAVFLLIQVGVLVFVYSQLLPQYLFNGAQQAAGIILEAEAGAAAERLLMTGTLPENEASGTQIYASVDAMPEHLKAVFERRVPLRENRLYFQETDRSGVMLFNYRLEDGRQVIALFEATRERLSRPGGPMDQMMELLEFQERLGLGFVVFWGVLTLLLLRRIFVRTRRMSQWTRSLTASNAAGAKPRFGYGEFDEVGRELKEAAERISAALARESEFVRNASHELRTPITIIQSNLDLERTRNGTESEPLSRIRRATHRMQRLIDTLLWLSREESSSQGAEPVDLLDLAHELVDEHSYLLSDQEVIIASEAEEATVTLPPHPLRIALANLIRNAFEHGAAGRIRITLMADEITVENSLFGASYGAAEPPGERDGLGLTLVRKVTERMGWTFSQSTAEDTHFATLQFQGAASESL
ncbi:MAG: HAMP domain-containing sensor histidine kinase [Pseudomonadota bacterium]